MPNPFAGEEIALDVLVNDDGQHSLWPSHIPTPAGWRHVLRAADRSTCLSYVASTWTDLRPHGLDLEDLVPTGASLPELFQKRAMAHPEAVAVTSERGELTYGELDRRSDEMARALVAIGVEQETRVGLLLDRSADLVTALMAVLKAGGVYVPLAVDAPLARLTQMADHIGFPVLLVDEATAGHPFTAASRGRQVYRADQPAPAVDTVLPVLHPDQLAYIIHTSGSTGTPKGATVTHRAVATFATDQVWQDSRQRAVLMAAPPIFDGMTYEVWVPLLAGGRLVVTPPELPDLTAFAGFIERSGATSALFIPYVLNWLVENALESLGGLELIWTGGDVVSGAVLERLLARYPAMRVATAWGTTETTMISSWYPVPAPYRAGASVPIGRPMDETRIHVLDDTLRPVGVGEVGEAYIGGIGLARGYEGRPDLTAERFVAEPDGAPGSRMYRTSDLVRVVEDGNHEFVGRVDQMVKVRGYRIEPGEVEAGLAQDPAVSQVAVVAPIDEGGQRYLVAHVVPAGGKVPSDDELRAIAAAVLPDYMIPDQFVVATEMPLTSSGKIDRRKLLAAL